MEPLLASCPEQEVALAGTGWQIGTKDEVLAALRLEMNADHRDSFEDELTTDEMKHLYAVRWAARLLIQNNVVEP